MSWFVLAPLIVVLNIAVLGFIAGCTLAAGRVFFGITPAEIVADFRALCRSNE